MSNLPFMLDAFARTIMNLWLLLERKGGGVWGGVPLWSLFSSVTESSLYFQWILASVTSSSLPAPFLFDAHAQTDINSFKKLKNCKCILFTTLSHLFFSFLFFSFLFFSFLFFSFLFFSFLFFSFLFFSFLFFSFLFFSFLFLFFCIFPLFKIPTLGCCNHQSTSYQWVEWHRWPPTGVRSKVIGVILDHSSFGL